VLECWSAGVLECWSAGVLEWWSNGVLVVSDAASRSVKNAGTTPTSVPAERPLENDIGEPERL
jgi:hypothetical protein